MSRSYEVSGREKTLRAAIIAAPVLAAPIPPAAVLGIHLVWVLFTVLAAISGGYAVLFYAVWLLGVTGFGISGYGSSPQLMGDDNLYAPRLYWPWGPYQARIRRERRVRTMERECGLEAYPLG